VKNFFFFVVLLKKKKKKNPKNNNINQTRQDQKMPEREWIVKIRDIRLSQPGINDDMPSCQLP